MVKLDIEIPSSCKRCQFKTHDSEGREKCELIKNKYNYITYWKYTGKDACERHPNCPLIECEEK